MIIRPGVTTIHNNRARHASRIPAEAELIQRSRENPTTIYVRCFPGEAPTYLMDGRFVDRAHLPKQAEDTLAG